VSGTYHSTSTDDNQLSVAHLVEKDRYIYNKDNIWKGVLPCNLSQYHPRTLHIVHNTTRA
jgi:hypothetical protein